MEPVIVSAPGKVIIHGEHAVVYGKEALASCIDKRVKCCVKKIENSENICLRVWIDKESTEWTFKKALLAKLKGPVTDAKIPSPLSAHNLLGLKKLLDSEKTGKIELLLLFIWTGLYLGIASDYFIERTEGLSMEIRSELALGAGIGSSASVSVCMVAAFLAICGFSKPVQGIAIDNDRWKQSFQVQDLSLINGWAYEAEKIVHGKPSGVDNSVITYGGALSYKCGEINFLKSFPPVRILLVNSGVSRSTIDIVNGVKQRHSELPDVYEAIFNAVDKLTEAAKLNFLELDRKLKEEANSTELDIIYNKIIELVDMNQNLLRAIGVSHESIESILDIFKKHDFKGKLTGAGGGGCVFSIIRPDVTKELHESGFVSWMVELGGQGVKFESPAE